MRIRELDDITAQATFTDSDGKKHCVNIRGKLYLKITAYWIDDVWQEQEIGKQICERMASYGNTLMNASGGVAATLRREWAKCRRELRKEERA
jgi:hypothetical protein